MATTAKPAPLADDVQLALLKALNLARPAEQDAAAAQPAAQDGAAQPIPQSLHDRGAMQAEKLLKAASFQLHASVMQQPPGENELYRKSTNTERAHIVGITTPAEQRILVCLTERKKVDTMPGSRFGTSNEEQVYTCTNHGTGLWVVNDKKKAQACC